MEKRRQDDLITLSEWFDTYDVSHTGAFEREEMKTLLTQVKREVTNDSSAAVKESLLDKVMKKYGSTSEGRAEKGVARADAQKAVAKYKAWMKYERHLEKLFEKADVDHSGRLSESQLKKLLQQVALEQRFNPKITQEDVDFVMGQIEEEHKGELTLEEAGQAVAIWTDIAQQAPPDSILDFCLCGGGKKRSSKVTPVGGVQPGA